MPRFGVSVAAANEYNRYNGLSAEAADYFRRFFCNKNFTLKLAKIFDKIEKSAKLNINIQENYHG